VPHPMIIQGAYSIRATPGAVRIRPGKRLSVLLLCDDFKGHANTILDHIVAFTEFSNHDIRVFCPNGISGSKYLNLDEFDVVVIHYSVMIISDLALAPRFREQLRRFQGLKVQFIQDEYRNVDEIVEMMRFLGINVLFTLLTEPDIPKLYPEDRLPGVVKLTTLAGFVPRTLVNHRTSPLAGRALDIGYRGRTLPFWLGMLGQEKAAIGQGVLSRAARYHLRCDIGWAEEDRIYGRRWIDFLTSCKATLGTESGSSITDFDGTIERRTKRYLMEHPQADFAEVHRAILQPYEGNVRVTAISPRVFEAAALRTAMVLFPGRYSGMIQPWTHYIPLAKDLSNMEEVAEKLRDLRFLEGITDQAYHDLVASGRYSQDAFARDFDEVLLKYGSRCGRRSKLCYHLASLERPYYKARESLQPMRRVPMDLIKAALTLILLVQTEGGWKLLRSYVASAELRKAVPFHALLRDILKLAVLGQILSGQRTAKKPFTVSVRVNAEQGRIVFESSPDEQALDQDRNNVSNATWQALASVVRERRARLVVWDHSVLGGNVRYALGCSIGLTVCVGDSHHFHNLVELAQRDPETACAVMASILKRGTAA
jgi:hypothetical protein